MGTTYYVNKTMTLFGSYICSKCKSVILVQLAVKAAGASTWSQKKASETMDEATEKIIKAMQDFHEKPFLVTKMTEGRTFTTAYELSVEDAERGCPCCGNREIWQRDAYYADACRMDPVTGVYLVSDCPERSKMRVFSALDTAKEYAGKLLAFTTRESAQFWQSHPNELMSLRSQIQALMNKIAELEPQKASARDKSHGIFEEIERKETEMKGYSLFSSEKKAAKAELKTLRKQYEVQKDADLVQERKLEAEIKELDTKKKELLFANPGVMGKAEVFNSKGMNLHDAYRYS